MFLKIQIQKSKVKANELKKDTQILKGKCKFLTVFNNNYNIYNNIQASNPL